MLNRRTLRIKAMQTLFAIQTAKEAEYNIALDKVKAHFLPDLNSMEEQNKELLAENRKLAGEAFVEAFDNGLDSLNSKYSEEILEKVKEEIAGYEVQTENLGQSYKTRLIADTKKIYDQYLSILQLLPAIQLTLKNTLKKGETSNFINNTVVGILSRSEKLEKASIQRGVSWQNETDTIRSWVKKIFKPDEVFSEYEQSKSPSFEADKEVIKHVYKSFIFRNETIVSFFEANDLSWSENSAVLKSMALKTIKSLENAESDLVLMELSKNWEEDLVFLERIFDETIKHEAEYSKIVSEKSKNWEIERVAQTDKIILEMALAEMINFSSIPVKVTINEYIELSKLYSTPKSKQFINGILDVLSGQLKKEGRIKKSGRGLLDNK